MCLLTHTRLMVTILFVVLTVSFLWCTVDNILHSTQVMPIGTAGVVSTAVVLQGFLWLVGHGIHGAALFALPAILLQRAQPRRETFGGQDGFQDGFLG